MGRVWEGFICVFSFLGGGVECIVGEGGGLGIRSGCFGVLGVSGGVWVRV